MMNMHDEHQRHYDCLTAEIDELCERAEELRREREIEGAWLAGWIARDHTPPLPSPEELRRQDGGIRWISEAAEGGADEVIETSPKSQHDKQGAAGEASTTASPAVADPTLNHLGEFNALVSDVIALAVPAGVLRDDLVWRGYDEHLIGRACLAGHLDVRNCDDGFRYWPARKEAAQ